MTIWTKLETCRLPHPHEELRSIIRPNLLRNIQGVEGFEGVKKAPRPHGTDRRYLGLRFRNKSEKEEDLW